MSDEINQISIRFSDSSLYEPVYDPYNTPPNSREPLNDLDSNQLSEAQSNEYAVYNNSHRERTWFDRFLLHWKKMAALFVLLAISITIGLVVEIPDYEDSILETTTSNDSSAGTQNINTTSTESTEAGLSTKDILTAQTSFPITYSPLLLTPEVNHSETTTVKPGTTTGVIAETTPVNEYTEWGTWSVCSKSCGVGEKVRERNCLKSQCHQLVSETIECIKRGCKSLKHNLNIILNQRSKPMAKLVSMLQIVR